MELGPLCKGPKLENTTYYQIGGDHKENKWLEKAIRYYQNSDPPLIGSVVKDVEGERPKLVFIPIYQELTFLIMARKRLNIVHMEV